MGWTQVAAIAGIVAAIFAAAGFLHGLWVRWPRLAPTWEPQYSGGSHGGSGPDEVGARLRIENHGGATARYARLRVELDGEPVRNGEQTLSLAPDHEWHADFPLFDPQQAELRADGTLDLHGKTLRARLTYRRTSWWPVTLTADSSPTSNRARTLLLRTTT